MQPTALICLPFAGAGASFFKKWHKDAPEGLHITAVQLPGREERFLDDPLTDASAAAEEAWERVAAELETTERAVVFGHSLGAVLAYELAHRIAERGPVPLERLVVSGSAGPWKPRTGRATGLSDEQFLTRVRGFAGYSHEAMRNPEMLELLLPLLRADVEMHENYRPSTGTPLKAPITALRGTDDDLVDAAETSQWAATTTGAFTTAELPGGHMYLTDHGPAVMRLIAAQLNGTHDLGAAPR
ncbi:thioesterase II family protein [Streptomyces fuscichromogenes]|uniref:thioesterase II family protein n=1 Tax=Streptomyces fuscichromogenes TaxID=1324013 RepID=UPI00381DE805